MDFKRKQIYKHIGARIAYFRALNDMSQDELAHRIHISRGTLSKIERGSYAYHVRHDLSAMEGLFAGYINARLDTYL